MRRFSRRSLSLCSSLYRSRKTPFIYSSSHFFSTNPDLTHIISAVMDANRNVDFDELSETEIWKTITKTTLGNRDIYSKITKLSREISLSTQKPPVRVTVTGAAGSIGYALLFRIAAGHLLGLDQPVILQCLEVEPALPALEGVAMELKDCAFPLLKGVTVTSDAEKAFEGTRYALLVGAQPRGKGMDRADLLKKNATIFSAQGRALDKTSDRENVKILVVGNPANTNCLIASANAPNISPRFFSAMTRLDHNRGLAQLSNKLNIATEQIEQFCIWGNHSDTQFPDVTFAKYKGNSLIKLLNNDTSWITNNFIPVVAKRGAAIIEARGASSAASAAAAAIDQIRDWALDSSGWVSMAVWTGNDPKKTPYGTSPDIYYSFPVVCKNGDYTIVEGLRIESDSFARMKNTDAELVKEKADVGELAKRISK